MENAKEKILVCGGAGYVGGHLTDLLANKGYKVAVYDNLTYEDRYLKNINFIFGDIRDKEKLGRVISEFDIVVWLAAIVGDGACAINPSLTTEINLSAIEWLTKNYKGKIVYTSTCSVYGINNSLIDESAAVNPLSQYASTKYAAEQEIIKNSQDYLIFRLGTLFGIGDAHSRIRLDLVVNTLVEKAVSGEHLSVFGGGQWRPLLHVKDVAEAILFGIENNITGLYNLSNKNYKICDIAEEIQNLIPSTRVEYGNLKFEDLRNYRVSAAKYKAYGWEPKYDLTYGINEIHKMLTAGRIKEPKNILYSNAAYLKNKVL